MLDRSGDWCFEGGCTYLARVGDTVVGEPDSADLEDFYREPCVGSYD